MEIIREASVPAGQTDNLCCYRVPTVFVTTVVTVYSKRDSTLMLMSSSVLGNDQLDALFHVFIYLFHVSACFERHSAHHQEIELY